MKRTATADARAVKTLELRLAGASYREIGAALKVSHVQAIRDVTYMLRQYASQPADEVREVERRRLDRLLLSHWPAATGQPADLKAATMVLQIMDRRARYLGLDAPQKVDITSWVREVAEREGLDVEQAIRDAEAITKAARL